MNTLSESVSQKKNPLAFLILYFASVPTAKSFAMIDTARPPVVSYTWLDFLCEFLRFAGMYQVVLYSNITGKEKKKKSGIRKLEACKNGRRESMPAYSYSFIYLSL